VLLRVERNAGHGGADNVRAAIEQGVDMYAWLFAQLDVR
jgi:prolyl oligopeptidase